MRTDASPQPTTQPNATASSPHPVLVCVCSQSPSHFRASASQYFCPDRSSLARKQRAKGLLIAPSRRDIIISRSSTSTPLAPALCACCSSRLDGSSVLHLPLLPSLLVYPRVFSTTTHPRLHLSLSATATPSDLTFAIRLLTAFSRLSSTTSRPCMEFHRPSVVACSGGTSG